ncbi:hypothetical protein ACFWN1_09435 [Streptomyces sp. NPDC058459]|uniref:hypothetical protein n=1 Tax=Streptomyces sp. NPDC058459 TaxID=3346508 RepID=UPI003651265D
MGRHPARPTWAGPAKVELAGVARWFAGQVERGEQFVAHRAGGGPGPEGDSADVLAGFECVQAGVDGEGHAEAGVAVQTHHRPDRSRVRDRPQH